MAKKGPDGKFPDKKCSICKEDMLAYEVDGEVYFYCQNCGT
ncbi:hypothetical protein ACQPZP_13125 [Spirillospora sp. CA-142024]